MTQLTYYTCENPDCPLGGIAYHVREDDKGRPLMAEAAVCSCGTERTRLDETAVRES